MDALHQDDVHIVAAIRRGSYEPEDTVDVYIDRARWAAMAGSPDDHLRWEIEPLFGAVFCGYDLPDAPGRAGEAQEG